CAASLNLAASCSDRWPPCVQITRKTARFQVKTTSSQTVLLGRAPIPLAPLRHAQIDAAQQRSQLLCRDLPLSFSGAVFKRNRVRPFLQPLAPDREAVAVPVQNLDAVPAPACEH